LVRKFSIILLFLLLVNNANLQAYSVLTHQAIIDGAWQSSMVPVLKQKYPGISQKALQTARAYAYGGSIIQDIGYYPMGSKLFTNLTHYVRTGDFVNNLISEAHNANEYAFALGALSHYYADMQGHSLGTNLSVPLIYPEVGAKYGTVVTYDEDHKSHTRTEFGFDVIQAASHEYEPEAFRDYIGFKVARSQLERAFQQTYGLKLKQIFVIQPISEAIFQFSVKSLIPQFTKMAWFSHHKKIESAPAVNSKQLAGTKNKDLTQEFEPESPGFTAKVMSLVFRVVPKAGPLSALNFKIPPPEAETLFVQSIDHSIQLFEESLFKLRSQPYLELASYDLDTGSPTVREEYNLADETHQQLLNRQSKNDFQLTSAPLKNYLLSYFAGLPQPAGNSEEKEKSQETFKNLKKLQEHQPKAEKAKTVALKPEKP
jgi:hypothetical protein